MGKLVEKKLIEIKNELEEKFGKNEKGRGHWREVEFIRNRLLHYFPTNFKMTTKTKQPILNRIRSNSNPDLATFPVYVLRYKNQDNTARMEKLILVEIMEYFQILILACYCWRMNIFLMCGIMLRYSMKSIVQQEIKRNEIRVVVKGIRSDFVWDVWFLSQIKAYIFAKDFATNAWKESMIICFVNFLKLNYVVQFVKDNLRMNFVLNLTRWKSHCYFLAILKKYDSCIWDFDLTLKCKHFGKGSVIKGSPSRRRDDEEILVGSKYSFANSQQKK